MSEGVLVTGGAGYIGSHVVIALQEAGYEVTVVDDLSTGARSSVASEAVFLEGNVGNREFVRKVLRSERISTVIHMAGSIDVAESVVDPVKYYVNNTARSLVLIEETVAAGINRFVFSSTAAVYGVTDEEAVHENSPLTPASPYGRSKLMTEQMLYDVSDSTGSFDAICLRYFNVAGADHLGRAGQQGPRSTHLIRRAIDTALHRQEELQIFGGDYPTSDGTCVRDYIHVSDLATAHVAAVQHLRAGCGGGALNCGYGTGYSVLDVVKAVEAVIGRELPISMGERRRGDPPRLVANSDRLKAAFDWRPQYAGLAEIVGSALRWERRRLQVD